MAQKYKILILVVLHLVGMFGFAFEKTQHLFVQLVPLHLLVVTVVLFLKSENTKAISTSFLLLAASIGLLAEWLGVNYGILFGNYHYATFLGPAFQGVPYVIGILWAGLAVSANDFVSYFYKKGHPVMHAFFAASIMCLFDFLLEPFAVQFGLWTWAGNIIPLYNYVTWWGVGFLICLLYQLFFKTEKQIASIFYLGTQSLFFIIVLLLHSL